MPNLKKDIIVPKSNAQRWIYAYSISDEPHAGLLKIGHTIRNARQRVSEQLKTPAIENYRIELEEIAEKFDGTTFMDHDVRRALSNRGFETVKGEWVRCSVKDLKSVLIEIKTGKKQNEPRHENFEMREEQKRAVEAAHSYFISRWAEDRNAKPRFLWNAKMRFGKTFATYQLVQKMGAMRVLIATHKPAVEDAWHSDIKNHVDFDGWNYMSKGVPNDLPQSDSSKPFIYFGSFQDLLGRDKNRKIKPKNRWLHKISWDLVVFDEYHFGAWREAAKELFEGEDDGINKKELEREYNPQLKWLNKELELGAEGEAEFLQLKSKAFLYLSGTPFRALNSGEFVEEQIFHWTYTDEQNAREAFAERNPGMWNPYESLPRMALFAYQMPDNILSVAKGGEFNEFDLNEFFAAEEHNNNCFKFKHENEVQNWLDLIRGQHVPTTVDSLKTGERPPLPYSDTRLLDYMQHSFWFLPNVASCRAMGSLLMKKHNVFWHKYDVVVAAGYSAGLGRKALKPVQNAIGNGDKTSTITLSCGKLATGVTVPQWSSILMLRNLKSPETYFQAAFRVQSPWTIPNPHSDDPAVEHVVKPMCFVFDFALTRALRQISEYGVRLSPKEPDPEKAVKDLVSFLPVLAYDGGSMIEVNAGDILDMAMAGTSATLLSRKWESATLVNVDDKTLQRILNNPTALNAIQRIEGWRSLGDNIIETIVNKADDIRELRDKERSGRLSKHNKRILTEEEKEYRSLRKSVQKKLIKFATRIPVFMYLTDFRENTLKDVITKLEPNLFMKVTGLSIDDFKLLISLGVFNSERMNQAVFTFRRYEDASLKYTGIDSHKDLKKYGLYDKTVPNK